MRVLLRHGFGLRGGVQVAVEDARAGNRRGRDGLELPLTQVVGLFPHGHADRDVGRDDQGVDDGTAVIGDEIDGAARTDLEIGIEGAVVAVAAGIEQGGLARADLGTEVTLRNDTLLEYGAVVCQEAPGDVDRPLGGVEDLDPASLPSVVVHDAGGVRNGQGLGDDEVDDVLGAEARETDREKGQDEENALSHNGRLSCFLAGTSCCLFASCSRARITRKRVFRGSMISSM